MPLLTLVAAALLTLDSGAQHAPAEAGGAIFEATGGDPYYRGKLGFSDMVHTKDHAYREFQKEVAAGRLDPSRKEWYCYCYYLYLINNHGRLIQFKARRDLDPGNPAALRLLPVKPRPGLDWLD